ncbi:cation diffusion facilitator family transporter [Thalassobacter stenotrophicus]|uniref:cation diffusion facilitator family transporter n=1 Tax=Thalassobacter stenotrophicus TaxID=266809 RepID=UPI0038B53F2D
MASHAHSGHMPSSGNALVISAWFTGVYFVIELAVGLWTGSITVLSDAFHTLSAVGGVLVAIIAQRIARRPADSARSFGWYRAEIIGALVNGSLLIIVTALVIEFTGFLAIDPILGMAFGVVLLWASVGVIKEAVHILMEGTPEGTDLEAVTADLRGQDGVPDVHHVHAWTLTSGKHAFSAHIRHGEPAEAAGMLNRAYHRLTE